jgi:hypothetical protein
VEFLNRSSIAAAGCEIFISFFGPCDPAALDAFLETFFLVEQKAAACGTVRFPACWFARNKEQKPLPWAPIAKRHRRAGIRSG